MLIFQILVGIIWIWGRYSPLPIGSDAIFESQYAGTIISSGHWDVYAGEGFSKNYYGYSPLIHMTMASLSLLTGTDVFVIGKFFPFLERILYFTVMYFILKKMISEKIAVLATLFIFSSSPLILIHTSRRLLAEPFFLLVLCTLFNQLKYQKIGSDKKNNVILLILFTTAVILGHHMTFYFLIFTLFFIFAYLLVQKLRNKTEILESVKSNWLAALSLFVLFVSGMMVLLYSKILDRDLGRLFESMDALLSVNISSADSTISSVGSTSQYPQFYVIMAISFVFLFYLTLLISFIKHIRKTDNYFLTGWHLSSAFLLFIPAVAILTGTRVGRLFGTVGWGIGAIGMSILVSKFLWDWWKSNPRHTRLGLVILVVTLYCGGLLVAYPIQYYVTEDSESAINNQIIFAGKWLEEQTERNEVIGGDRISFDVISGVNMRYVRYDTNGLFFASSMVTFQYNLTEYYDTYLVKLYVVNEVVTRVQAVGFSVVPAENLNKFNEMYGLNKIYSNNEVHIYYIHS